MESLFNEGLKGLPEWGKPALTGTATVGGLLLTYGLYKSYSKPLDQLGCEDQQALVEKLKKQPTLQDLTLLNCPISDDALINITKNNRNINNLFLENGVDLTDEGLSKLGRLRELKVLSIAGAEKITSEGLGEIIKINSLEVFSIGQNAHINTDDLKTFLQQKRDSSLKEIRILDCTNVDVAALQTWAQGQGINIRIIDQSLPPPQNKSSCILF